MKDLIKYIVRALVDHPEQIEISETIGEQGFFSYGLSEDPFKYFRKSESVERTRELFLSNAVPFTLPN